MAEKINSSQSELELGIEIPPVEPGKESLPIKNRTPSFLTELETSLDLNSTWSELTGVKETHLEPKDVDDPFYIAQLRTRELETLQMLNDVQVLNEGLPFEQELTMSALVGLRTRDDLNHLIPQGIRNQRLAFSTFTLTALEHSTRKSLPLTDDEAIVVTGLFNGFSFDIYDKKETIVIPLINPWIRKPRFLRDVELDSVKIPVLSVGDWKWTIPRN